MNANAQKFKIICTHLLKEILFSDSANFSDVINETNVPFRRSVAFTDTDISETLQKVGPGVNSDAVPDCHADLVVSVTGRLGRGRGAGDKR
jgi:hypothetical protein